MKESIKQYFLSKKIEYYAVLDYNDCTEINPHIMARESFTPRSVIVYLLPYYTGETINISRYAASLDYHMAIREIGEGLISVLSDISPESHFKSYGDHSPINEVNAALISGLGRLGDNGLIINDKYGSYIFIGDVVTDIDPYKLGAQSPCVPTGCLHCKKCISACPTGCLSGASKECLSEITQRKSELFAKEAELLRKYNTVWGCDICQEVCPYNRDPVITPIEFFHKDRIDRLDLDILASMDKAAFSKRAYAWRGRRTVERNCECIMQGAECIMEN